MCDMNSETAGFCWLSSSRLSGSPPRHHRFNLSGASFQRNAPYHRKGRKRHVPCRRWPYLYAVVERGRQKGLCGNEPKYCRFFTADIQNPLGRHLAWICVEVPRYRLILHPWSSWRWRRGSSPAGAPMKPFPWASAPFRWCRSGSFCWRWSREPKRATLLILVLNHIIK